MSDKEIPGDTNLQASSRSDEALVQRVRDQLDADVARQDGATRSALNRARASAMQEAESPARPAWARWQVPAGTAAAGLAAVLLYPGTEPAEEPATASADAELRVEGGLLESLESDTFDEQALALIDSLSGEDLDFYAELAFIEWLDEQADAMDSPDSSPNADTGSVHGASHHVG